MISRLAAIAAFAFVHAAAAMTIPSTCESALRRALDSDAAWRMERKLAGSTATLVSTGVVSCAAGRGIVWDVRHPFPSTATMTTNEMVFADEDGRRVKPLKDLPHYDDVRRETDAFLAGDPKAFDGAFTVETRFLDDGRWTLRFEPKVGDMKRLAESVEITGGATVDKAVLKSADGGVTTLVFTELARRGHLLWKE